MFLNVKLSKGNETYAASKLLPQEELDTLDRFDTASRARTARRLTHIPEGWKSKRNLTNTPRHPITDGTNIGGGAKFLF